MTPPTASRRSQTIVSWSVVGAANLAFCVLISVSPAHPIYDEPWFLNTVVLFKQRGFTIDFLREFPGAPGPTFTIVYALVDRVVGLTFPWSRFISFALLIAATVLLWRILEVTLASRAPAVTATSPSPALLAASFTMLPTVGVSAGMILTEMPAALFMVAALSLIGKIIDDKSWRSLSIPAALVCGLAMAAAALGRQNYIVILPCLLLAIRWRSGAPSQRDIVRIALIGAVVLLVTGPVFLLWGGFIPPRSASDGAGVSLSNGIRSAGYAGAIIALFAPEIYTILIAKKWLAFAIAIVSIALSFAIDRPIVPLASLLGPLLSETMFPIAGIAFNVLLSLMAVSFLVCWASFIWRERANWFIRLCGCTALAGIISNAKISHQFSSRYVFVFLPFVLLAAATAVRSTWHQPVRLALGAGISLGALVSYYLAR
jgi:hypothetical protein